MIILLFISFAILIVLTYIIFDGDIMAPSFIFCAMYFFSIGCALVNYRVWGLNIITNQLFFIYFFGAVLFIFIGYVCKFLFSNKYHKPSKKGLRKIYVNKLITLSFAVFNLITLFLWVINVFKIAGGGSSFSEVMEAYRLKTSYSFEATMPGYILQMCKVTAASAFIYVFAFLNNILVKKPNTNDYLLLINPIIYVILSLFSSDRLSILQYISTIVVYYYLLAAVKKNIRKHSIKLIIKLIVAFVLILGGFYGIRLVVGRVDSEGTDLISYITMYAGGPVKLFDLFLQQPVHSPFWGKETFIAINKTFNKLGLFNIPQYLVHKEFRSYNGISLGNVYSAYRNWYADFNLGGTFLLQGVFSVFFNTFYYKLRGSYYYDLKKFSLIIYGYMASSIFLHPIDDEFYRYTVSIGFLIYLVVFWFLYYALIVKSKFKE